MSFACVYVSMCVYVSTFLCFCLHVCLSISVCVIMCVCQILLFIYIWLHMKGFLRLCLCLHSYEYECVCVFKCVFLLFVVMLALLSFVYIVITLCKLWVFMIIGFVNIVLVIVYQDHLMIWWLILKVYTTQYNSPRCLLFTAKLANIILLHSILLAGFVIFS